MRRQVWSERRWSQRRTRHVAGQKCVPEVKEVIHAGARLDGYALLDLDGPGCFQIHPLQPRGSRRMGGDGTKRGHDPAKSGHIPRGHHRWTRYLPWAGKEVVNLRRRITRYKTISRRSQLICIPMVVIVEHALQIVDIRAVPEL